MASSGARLTVDVMQVLARGCLWAAFLLALACSPSCKCTAGPDGIKIGRSGPEPEELATKEHTPRRLVVDDTHVYWTDWGYGSSDDRATAGLVKRVAKTGKGKVEVFAGAQSHPADITTDATTVYWANEGDGTIMKLAKTGGTPTILTADIRGPAALLADPSGLYVGTRANEIWMTSAVGATPKKLATLDAEPRRLLTDDKDVFSIDEKGHVDKIAKDSGARTRLAQGSEETVLFDNSIAIDRANVYFADGKDVMSVPKAGGALTKVIRLLSAVRGLAADGRDVFALDSDQVTRVPAPGFPGLSVAEVNSPALLTIDATHVYWCNGIMDVAIERRPKR